jgi:hypothetical protein
MQFAVDFIVNDQISTSIVNYSADLAESEQFSDYVNATNYLYPLRFAASFAKTNIAVLNRTAIKDLTVDDQLWLNLRFFDGINNAWFDNLNLPAKEKMYVVSTKVHKFLSPTRIVLYSALFKQQYILKTYDILACTFPDHMVSENPSSFIKVDMDLCNQFPAIRE